MAGARLRECSVFGSTRAVRCRFVRCGDRRTDAERKAENVSASKSCVSVEINSVRCVASPRWSLRTVNPDPPPFGLGKVLPQRLLWPFLPAPLSALRGRSGLASVRCPHRIACARRAEAHASRPREAVLHRSCQRFDCSSAWRRRNLPEGERRQRQQSCCFVFELCSFWYASQPSWPSFVRRRPGSLRRIWSARPASSSAGASRCALTAASQPAGKCARAKVVKSLEKLPACSERCAEARETSTVSVRAYVNFCEVRPWSCQNVSELRLDRAVWDWV